MTEAAHGATLAAMPRRRRRPLPVDQSVNGRFVDGLLAELVQRRRGESAEAFAARVVQAAQRLLGEHQAVVAGAPPPERMH
jgi:broad specificity phosphatase PhoE